MIPATPPYRCWAEIDLGALERNLRKIRAALPAHLRYVAVVKADAYGHGVVPTVARLMHAGVDLFAVANLEEAQRIEEVGTGWPILVLSPVLPHEDARLAETPFLATVSSLDEIERFAAIGRTRGMPQRVHLKIDTGMGRLGIWHESADAVIETLLSESHIRLEGLFTHFSSATTDTAFTRLQRERFLAVWERFRGRWPDDLLVHTDNSAGLESFASEGPTNAVRIGMLQFGVAPYERSLFGHVRVEPVLSFRTRVGLVKTLPAGTPISYGQTRTLQRDSRVAVLTAGYGDGIPSAMSNLGEVLIRGSRCPILGRVTMDQTIVDTTDLNACEVGEVATMIGRDGEQEIMVETYADWARELTWETFCSITQRVPRVYRAPLGT